MSAQGGSSKWAPKSGTRSASSPGGALRCAIYERRRPLMARRVTAQRRRCLCRVAELGGSIDLRRDVYFDMTGEAGSSYRLGREQVLSRAVAGDFDTVIVWELTDIARNSCEVRLLARVLRSAGCDLHVMTLPAFSLFGPAGLAFDVLL